MTINLTIRQRIAIESLFGAREGRTLKEQLVPYDILQKTNLTAEDKKKYLQVADGRVILNEAAMTDGPIPFEFSGAEVEETEKLISTAKLSPMDLEWALPLSKQLKG